MIDLFSDGFANVNNTAIYVDSKNPAGQNAVVGLLSEAIRNVIKNTMKNYHHDFVIVNIGTDRSTGDSFGPLTGTMLNSEFINKGMRIYETVFSDTCRYDIRMPEKFSNIASGKEAVCLGLRPNMHKLSCYGTLEYPVHAANINDTLKHINDNHNNPYIFAVDACLGLYSNVGKFSIQKGPALPGSGLKKNLPPVGDAHTVGIINIGGFMEYMVLQNTRLDLVYKMSQLLSCSIFKALYELGIYRMLKESGTTKDETAFFIDG